MDFAILGPLEVRDGDRALPLGGLRERSLLALLLLDAGRPISKERLVDELWGERPPKTAVKTVQVYVSRLRRLLGAETIATSPHGYLLRVDLDRIDLHRFERLAAEGRRMLAAGDAASAARKLRDALSLWRGAPLSDFAYEPFAQAHVARTEELRLAALEDRIEADLRRGRAGELVAELQGLVARNPLRERFRAQLMLALYRAGRQADALDVYRDARATLVEELGIEPSGELRELERAILTQDSSLNRSLRPAPRAAGFFVGREAELSVGLEVLEGARSGRGGVVLLSGEPGIGKSRLAEELAAHARDRGMQVARGRSWEVGGAPPFWPWRQVLRACLREAGPAELRERVGGSAPELADLLPELRGHRGGRGRPGVRGPEALRFRLFEAVGSVLAAMAEERALLLVLDDLHAADESSLLLLQFVAGVLAEHPIALIGAYRDTEVRPDHPLARMRGELAREAGVAWLAMEGFSRTEVAAFVELSTQTPVPAELVEAIHRRTAGNPFFVTETVRLLASAGPPAESDLTVTVPAGVQDAVARRLERLPPTAYEALVVASVLGREFDPRVLEHLVSRDVADALDAAISARLVGAAPGAPGLLRFSHSLVRDAVYQAISPGRRRELHRRAASVLESRRLVVPWRNAATMAHHLFEAGATESAAEHARIAAKHACTQLAYEEAARLYRLALRALESGERVDGPALCETLLALGDAVSRAGDEAETKSAFLHAAEVARQTGTAEQLARAALGYGGRWVWSVMRGDRHVIPLLEEAIAALPPEDGPLRVRLLARLAGGPLKAQGDASLARRSSLSAEAVAMARRLGDPALLAWALDGRKAAIWGPDTIEQHWAIIDELARLAREAGDPEQLVDAHVCSLIELFERFEIERFEELHARATAAAEELGQAGQRWLVAAMAPMRALLVGRLDEAEHLIEESYRLGREAVPWNARVSWVMQRFVLGSLRGSLESVEADLRAAALDSPWFPTLHAALATLHAEQGDREQARAAFEPLAVHEFAAVPKDDEWLLTMGLLADACSFLADTERAGLLYRQLEPYAHRVVVGPVEVCMGTAARPLGKLAGSLGRTEAAVHWLERAATHNERAGALPWAAHARREQAEILVAGGDRSSAQPLFERAGAVYRSLGMERWERRCRAPAEMTVTAGA